MTAPLEMDCFTVKSWVDSGKSFLFLDCRETDEYAITRINGTLLIPISELAERAGELEIYRDIPIVVHCHHGGRSLRVTNWLRNQGFPEAVNLSGGIDEWSQQIDRSIPRY